MRASQRGAILLAGLSGTLLALAFPYFSLWPLAWIALVPLFVVLSEAGPMAGAMSGYVFGLALFGITLRWSAELDPPGSWLIWAAFVAIEALIPAAYGAVVSLYSRGLRVGAARPLFLAASWTLVEYLRSRGAYALTWSQISYSQLPSGVVVQLADLTGAWGVSFIVVLVNACVAEVWMQRRAARVAGDAPEGPGRALIVYASVVLIALSYAGWRWFGLPAITGQTVSVACVQPDVDPHEKWNPQRFSHCLQALEEATARAAAHGASLIIWPETAVPAPVLTDAALRARLTALAVRGGVSILVGSTERADDGSARNSGFLVAPDGRFSERYDKMHLVPFGEYLPLRSLLGRVPPFNEIADLAPGTDQTVLKAPSAEIGLMICFESTFSDIARAFVARGARLLVVITNDGWFNHTSAAEHHIAMSAMRSIEQRMWLVQCGNTGISAFVDPRGGMHEKTALFTSSEIYANVPLGSVGSLYQAWGDWFIAVLAVCCLGCVVARKKQGS